MLKSIVFFLMASSLTLAAQTQDSNSAPPAASSASSASPTSTAASSTSTAPAGAKQITVPAGTQVLLQMRSPIDTKSARIGDGVYCQSSFPVTINNVVVIPAGTYVKGRITKVQRAGRIKGRAEVLFSFDTMIFPNGYTVDLPGALQNEPGATNSAVADEEGTVKANGQKGKDTATVARTAGSGAAVGAIAAGGKGAGIGAAAGGIVGLATVLLTRGQDVRIEQGASLEMVIQRALTVDVTPGDPAQSATQVVPRPTNTVRLPVPRPPKP